MVKSEVRGKVTEHVFEAPAPPPATISDAEIDKVRSTLRTFVRDWAQEVRVRIPFAFRGDRNVPRCFGVQSCASEGERSV